jgi:hypothetical protein
VHLTSMAGYLCRPDCSWLSALTYVCGRLRAHLTSLGTNTFMMWRKWWYVCNWEFDLVPMFFKPNIGTKFTSIALGRHPPLTCSGCKMCRTC